MPKKQPVPADVRPNGLDCTPGALPAGHLVKAIDLQKIDRSPHQHRRHFDEDKLRELAASIQREGLIEPIVVRPIERRYELIAGERRLRAVRDYTEMNTIQAQIVIASDLQVRRISAAENMQREDLSAIETIETIVEIVDAELAEDIEYLSMGKTPAERVKTLLGKLDSMRRGKERGYSVSKEIMHTSNKFVGRVENVFANLPKHLEWLSFLNHDLPLLMDFCEEVQEVSIQHHLNKSQTRALAKLKETSEEEFQRIVTPVCRVEHSTGRQDETPALSGFEQVDQDFHKIKISDLSAREIEKIADKAAKKEALIERNRRRRSPSLSLDAKILLMNRLGIPVDRIAARLKVNRKTVLKYSHNPPLVQSIRELLEKGVSLLEVSEEKRGIGENWCQILNSE